MAERRRWRWMNWIQLLSIINSFDLIQVFYQREGVLLAAVQSAHVHNMSGLPAVVFPLHRSQQSRL